MGHKDATAVCARWKPSRTIQFSGQSSLSPCWTVAWVSIRAYGLPCVRHAHQLWTESASSCSAACRKSVRHLQSCIKSYSIPGRMSDGFLSSLWELKGTCKWSTWQGVKQALKICSFYLEPCWITWSLHIPSLKTLWVCVRRCLLRILVCSEESSRWNGRGRSFPKTLEVGSRGDLGKLGSCWCSLGKDIRAKKTGQPLWVEHRKKECERCNQLQPDELFASRSFQCTKAYSW